MKENQQEEIDLGLVFRKIGEAFQKILVWFYQGTQFLLRNWIIILVLIVAGGSWVEGPAAQAPSASAAHAIPVTRVMDSELSIDTFQFASTSSKISCVGKSIPRQGKREVMVEPGVLESWESDHVGTSTTM